MSKTTHIQAVDRPRYMDYRAASEYVQLSERKLASLVSRRLLRPVRVGKRVVFDVVDLDKFMSDAKR